MSFRPSRKLNGNSFETGRASASPLMNARPFFEVVPLASGDFRTESPIRHLRGTPVHFTLVCGELEGLLTDQGENLHGVLLDSRTAERVRALVSPATLSPSGSVDLVVPWNRLGPETLFRFSRVLVALASLGARRRPRASANTDTAPIKSRSLNKAHRRPPNHPE
ncbi:MAG: hypothetical protein ACYDEV_00485 [Acidiferrobacter sp.]